MLLIIYAIFFDMEMTYRLNTSELGSGFINSLRVAYPDQDIEILVRQLDETEYLCSSPANRERLEKSIENVKRGKVITFESIEQVMQRAEELAATQ
jgi:antitoxin YefM